MKRLTAFLMTVIMVLSIINFGALNSFGASSVLNNVYGWYETIHIEWTNDNNPKGAEVYYKLSSENSYTIIDTELIRANGSNGVADVVGIQSGVYDIKVNTSDGQTLTKNQIAVSRYDRSGYGHFGLTGGLGGYNDDGTPKDNAHIIYVTNDTKNTVSYGSNTGIGYILKNASNYSEPLIVRIIGTVDTQTRDADGTKTTDINNGVVAIKGLTDKVLSEDSYFNMLDVSSASNITVEGIGTDAVIEKWGFTFSKCNSIEVRNLTFRLYPEDACSFEGSSSSNSKYKNFWVHNNYFMTGENKYDLTAEQDKHEGDGSSDFKGCRNITYSYNVFEKCHKTSLHGGSDSSLQYNSTWHHNYFNASSSRLPLTRQVNLHSYNNYFYKGSKCIDSRASAWVLAEGNYFDNSTGILTTANKTYGDPVVKSIGNVFENSSGVTDNANTIVSTNDRTLKIDTSICTNSNKNPYPNFDTNTELFYYNSGKECSDVEYLTDANTAKTDALAASGVMAEGKQLSAYTPEITDITTETTTVSETSTEATTYHSYVNETVSVGSGQVYRLTPSTFSAKTYTESVTSDDGVFTLNANSSKSIKVSSSNIDLGGGGSTASPRNIAVNVTGPALFSVTYYNNGSSARVLEVKNSSGSFVKNMDAPNGGSETNTSTIECDLTSADTYYVYSTSGGIKITDITLTYPSGDTILIGDVNLDKNIDYNDAALLLKHIANISLLTDDNSLIAGDGNMDKKWTIHDVIAILKACK